MLIEGLKVFLVGGAVRDRLLGLPIKERDWVVIGSSEAEMLSRGFNKVGKDFPVFLHPKTKEEYALARIERKVAKGYYGFECDYNQAVTLEQDLSRRDLTINAMAEDLNGNIIDPFNGAEDLANRTLKHVSGAFIEDPVRVLRIARFAAKLGEYNFKVDPSTKDLIKQMLDNVEIAQISVERIWKELEKTLNTAFPDRFFELLREVGALKVLLPEFDKLWGIPQSIKWHPEVDLGIHTMLALQQAVKFSDDPKVRFAVLCHDLGKTQTPLNLLPKHYGHEFRGVDLIKNLCNRLKIPNAYKNFAIKVARWHLHSHKAQELTPKKLLDLLINLDVFRQPKILSDFILACKADLTGRKGFGSKEYLAGDFLQNIYQQIKTIDYQPYIARGMQGKKLGEAIKRERIRLISQCKKNI